MAQTPNRSMADIQFQIMFFYSENENAWPHFVAQNLKAPCPLVAAANLLFLSGERTLSFPKKEEELFPMLSVRDHIELLKETGLKISLEQLIRIVSGYILQIIDGDVSETEGNADACKHVRTLMDERSPNQSVIDFLKENATDKCTEHGISLIRALLWLDRKVFVSNPTFQVVSKFKGKFRMLAPENKSLILADWEVIEGADFLDITLLRGTGVEPHYIGVLIVRPSHTVDDVHEDLTTGLITRAWDGTKLEDMDFEFVFMSSYGVDGVLTELQKDKVEPIVNIETIVIPHPFVADMGIRTIEESIKSWRQNAGFEGSVIVVAWSDQLDAKTAAAWLDHMDSGRCIPSTINGVEKMFLMSKVDSPEKFKRTFAPVFEATIPRLLQLPPD